MMNYSFFQQTPLSIHHVPGTVLGTGDRMMHKTDMMFKSSQGADIEDKLKEQQECITQTGGEGCV